MDKIHRPFIVRPDGLLAILSELRLHPALRVLVPELQAQLVVNPASLLHVDHPALAPQKHVHALITMAHTRLGDLPVRLSTAA